MSNNAVLSQGKPIGDAILAFMNSNNYLNSLNLIAPAVWQRGATDPSSSRPANPYLQCPRIWLRLYTGATTPGTPEAGQKSFGKYTFSIYYWRKQNVGESHHQIMVENAEVIQSAFSGVAFRPMNLTAINGYSLWKMDDFTAIYHPQLKHSSGDPNLIVDVTELTFNVQGYLVPPS